MTKNFLKTLLLLVAITTGFAAKASLPALTESITKVSLPYTFSLAKPNGAFDINGDNIDDFLVEFFSNSGETGCIIMGANYASSQTNRVLSEYLKKKPIPEGVLTSGSFSYVSLLPSGSLIGADSEDWDAVASIMGENGFTSPLQESFPDVNSGYAGVQFYIGGQTHYGWLNVQIDPSQQFVTINSAGYQASAGLPAVAGLNDPFAVPVPIIASLLGLAAIGGGIFLKRRKKKVC
jgi:hypothetical protein